MASMFEASLGPTFFADGLARLGLDEQMAFRILLTFILGGAICVRLFTGKKTANFPLVNPAKGIELIDKARRSHFAHHPREHLNRGKALGAEKPFNLMTDSGEVTVLPATMVNEIRNEKGMSFMVAVAEDFHAHISGFETLLPWVGSAIALDHSTNILIFVDKVTKPLSEEADFATKLAFGTEKEWKEIVPYGPVLDVVARLSSRVFLGAEVCRDEEWLEITKSYTGTAFVAADQLRLYPNWLRNIVHWFLPKCKQTRAQVARARDLLQPVINKRRAIYQKAKDNGQPIPVFDDAVEWYEKESQGRPYDAAITQLNLSMAAIHTTTDLTTETLLRLSQDPKLVTELRKEITTVLRADGWKKTSLYNMKLLDSVVKETQRLKPITSSKFPILQYDTVSANACPIVSMQRKAMSDVKLATGQIIPKGARTVCSMDLMSSADEYANPLEFNGSRFADWRGTDKETSAHLVATGPPHLGFGHGEHACPGRFFAANEIKVILCHLIMKYDFKPSPSAPTAPLEYAWAIATNPAAKIILRRRPEVEIDIDSIE